MDPVHTHDNPLTQTILVTDSGLGGLSVFNDIANQLVKSSPWQRVKLVYFNAWPAPHRGYNHFQNKGKKIRVFNNAMVAMDKFHPDLILIACNTLSVIYPYTQFFDLSDTKVEEIVDHGVKMIYEKLMADPESIAVIFGTPTTIDAKSHKNKLIQMGIVHDRIINIGCTDLAGWIEKEPFSDKVEQLIKQFSRQAGKKLGNFNHKVYAALCCTHFGYKQELFTKAFKKYITGKVTILNPNIRMAGHVFDLCERIEPFRAKIDIKIVSKAVWEDEQINAYIRLLTDICPAVRDALKNYQLNTDLFSVD